MTRTMLISREEKRGSALVFALGILAIVIAFGVSMWKFGNNDRLALSNTLHAERAAWVSRGGVETAIAQLEAALATGTASELTGNPLSVEVPIYRQKRRSDDPEAPAPDPATTPPVIDDLYKATATVEISDECSRLNLNLAPPTVLMSFLRIDGDKARQIRERLPRLDGVAPAAGESRRWLATVEELVTLGLVPAETLTAERAKDLTVYSADLSAPAGFVNINTASSAVLEAALGITPDVVQRIIQARPITSVQALTAAAGKDVAGFNFKPTAEDPSGLPKELAFSSRCYRLVSRAEIVKPVEGQDPLRVGSATIEAVVQFPQGAAPRIVYWKETSAARSGA